MARSGVPVLNVRVKTIRHVALELASLETHKREATFLRGVQAEVLIDRVFGRLKKAGNGYLSSIEPGARLVKAILKSIQDLRLAGVVASDLHVSDFEVEAKGDDIKILLAEYEKELQNSRHLDYADILRIPAIPAV